MRAQTSLSRARHLIVHGRDHAPTAGSFSLSAAATVLAAVRYARAKSDGIAADHQDRRMPPDAQARRARTTPLLQSTIPCPATLARPAGAPLPRLRHRPRRGDVRPRRSRRGAAAHRPPHPGPTTPTARPPRRGIQCFRCRRAASRPGRTSQAAAKALADPPRAATATSALTGRRWPQKT